MKKHALLTLGLLLGLQLFSQDLDSLFRIFEGNRGAVAYRAAAAIDETIGREPNFDADTDKDEIMQKVLRTMILYFFNNNDFQHVLTYSEVGIAHYRKIGDLFNLAGCQMTLANAYQCLGQYDKAIECYNQCSDIMDEIGGEMAEVNKRYVINNIAEIHLTMDEFGTAEEMYRKCIEMLGTIDPSDTASNLDLATYYQNLAEVRIAQSKHGLADDAILAEAVDFAERSLDLSQRYHDTPHKLVNRMSALSKAYFATGRTDESLTVMDEALRLAQDQGEVFLENGILVQKGQFEAELGHTAEARRCYEEAIAMAETNHFDELLQQGLENSYQLLRDSDQALALTYLERSVAMKDSVFNQTQQQLIRDYQVRYAIQTKEHELQLQQEKTKRNRMYVVLLAVLVVMLAIIGFILYRLALVRKKRAEELARVNATKDRLLSIVSHDVKTPVGAICTVMRQLNAEYDTMTDTDRKASMVMVGASADALNNRVTNIMQWVKGELASSIVTPKEFDLHELVDHAIATHQSSIRMKALNVVNDVPQGLIVCDDPSIISLVLQNVLSNAVKFSYPKGEVHIRTEQSDGLLWVAVADNGMGIGEKKLEKIFNYMTTSAVGTDGETGTGIGLFVSKQLIDKTGGKISIESVKDEGTTVRFSVIGGNP